MINLLHILKSYTLPAFNFEINKHLIHKEPVVNPIFTKV